MHKYEFRESEFARKYVTFDEYGSLVEVNFGGQWHRTLGTFIKGLELLARADGGDVWDAFEHFMSARHDVLYFHFGGSELWFWDIEEIEQLYTLGFCWDVDTEQWCW